MTSATVIAYVLTLAVLGAVIVGVILALQVTSRRAQSGSATCRRKGIGVENRPDVRCADSRSGRSRRLDIAFRDNLSLAIGIVLGVAIAALIDTESGGELTGGAGLGMLAPVAVFVLMVGLIASAGPARRGLSIQPSEALKEQ